MKKSRKWLQQEAIQQRERQAAVKRSLLPGTISKNPTLRTQAERYEENTKVVAATTHQATRAIACSKKLIAPWYSIGFASFQFSIEANIASYAKL
jgi:hypothetical protein